METRRRFLGLASALAFAGCTGTDRRDGDSPGGGPATSPPGGEPATTATPGEAGPWSTFRADAANTGTADIAGPVKDAGALWTARAPLNANAFPTVADDAVYAAFDDGSVRALDLETGAEQWRQDGVGAATSPPAVVDGTVYASDGGSIVALSAADGTERWTAEEVHAWLTPTVDGGTVYAGEARHRLVAMDAVTGDVRWRTRTGGKAYGPAVVDGTAYVATDPNTGDGELVAFDAGTGERHWGVDLVGGATDRPAVGGGRVYAVTDDGRCHAATVDGQAAWTFVAPEEEWLTRGPVYADGTVFVADLSGRLFGLNAATGDERWRLDLGDHRPSRPAVAGDRLFVTAGATLYALDPDGAVLWSHAGDLFARGPPTATADAAAFGDLTGTVHLLDHGGTERWELVTKRWLCSSPVVTDGIVYVGGRGSGLSGFGAGDGTKWWHYADSAWSLATPAAGRSSVVAADLSGGLQRVPASGEGRSPGRLTLSPTPDPDEPTPSPIPHVHPTRPEPDWTTDLDAEVVASPTIVDGVAYLGLGDGTVRAVAVGGSERWRYDAGGRVESTPAVVGDTVYAGSDAGLHAIARGDGDERWWADLGDEVRSSPTVGGGGGSSDGGTVYVGADDGGVYAFDAAGGDRRWRVDTDGMVRSSPAVADECVYVGSADGAVYALAADDGDEQWTFGTGGPVHSSPAVASDTVYVGSRDRHVYGLAADDGSERWRFEANDWIDASPAVAYGAVYVTDQQGWLYALAERP